MQTPTILCVADQPTSLLILNKQLSQAFPGYSIEVIPPTAVMQRLALRLSEGGEVPLIISDGGLADVTGDSLLVTLQTRYPHILKIMLVESAHLENASEALETFVNRASLYRLIAKPWNPLDLKLTVSEALRRFQQEWQIRQQKSDSEEAQFYGEAQNRTILSAIPDILKVLDAEGRYLTFSPNQFSGDLLLVGNPEQARLRITDVLPQEVSQQCLSAIQQVLKTGEVQTYEQQISFDNRIQYEEVRIVPYQADQVLCIVRDISDRKQAELELSRSHDLREALFNESADALFLVDSETLLTVDCNQRAVALFEADQKDDLVNISGHTLQRYRFTEEELMDIAHQINTQGFWSREVEYVTLKGHRFWGNIAATQISMGHGTLNLVRVTDISDRKRTELQLKQTTNELNRFFSVALDLLCICDLNGKFLRLNPAWERTLGYPLEELQRQGFWQFIHPDDVDPTREAIASLYARGDSVNFVNRYRHRDGSYRWFEWRASVTGDLTYAAARDVTERKRVETQLESQNSLLARIARGEPLTKILTALIHLVEDNLQGALCSVLLLDEENRLRHGAALRLPYKYIQDVDGVLIGEGVGSCGTAAFRNETVITTDISCDPLWQDYRQIALKFGLQACWSSPILASDGRVLGTFGVYYQEVRSPQPTELEIIGQIANIAGIAIEREQNEAKIRKSEEQLQLTLDFTEIGTWNWNPSTGDYLWSGKMEELLELPLGLDNMFQLWLDRIHPDDVDRIKANIQQALDTHTLFAEEYRYFRFDGRMTWLWVRGQAIYDEAGAIIRVLGVVEDISDRKQSEEALRQSEAKNQAMLAAMPDLILRVKRDGTCLDFLPPAKSPQPAFLPIYNHIQEILPPDLLQNQIDGMERALKTGELQVWEQKLNRAGVVCDEEVRVVHCRGDEFLIMVRDITTRKQAEAKLRESLQEKVALLAEIHHRVKNNLQIISSLLNLQAYKIEEPQVRRALEDSWTRIDSMALVHEILYQSRDFSSISFAEYLNHLTHNLFHTYNLQGDRIQLQIQADQSITLNLDQAIPCGLIVNELITNAFKHAFQANSVSAFGGKLLVYLSRDTNRRIHLSVGNTGDLLPADFSLNKTRSMGLQLVNTLVHQLEGELIVERGDRTLFTITFDPDVHVI